MILLHVFLLGRWFALARRWRLWLVCVWSGILNFLETACGGPERLLSTFFHFTRYLTCILAVSFIISDHGLNTRKIDMATVVHNSGKTYLKFFCSTDMMGEDAKKRKPRHDNNGGANAKVAMKEREMTFVNAVTALCFPQSTFIAFTAASTGAIYDWGSCSNKVHKFYYPSRCPESAAIW